MLSTSTSGGFSMLSTSTSGGSSISSTSSVRKNSGSFISRTSAPHHDFPFSSTSKRFPSLHFLCYTDHHQLSPLLVVKLLTSFLGHFSNTSSPAMILVSGVEFIVASFFETILHPMLIIINLFSTAFAFWLPSTFRHWPMM